MALRLNIPFSKRKMEWNAKVVYEMFIIDKKSFGKCEYILARCNIIVYNESEENKLRHARREQGCIERP